MCIIGANDFLWEYFNQWHSCYRNSTLLIGFISLYCESLVTCVQSGLCINGDRSGRTRRNSGRLPRAVRLSGRLQGSLLWTLRLRLRSHSLGGCRRATTRRLLQVQLQRSRRDLSPDHWTVWGKCSHKYVININLS